MPDEVTSADQDAWVALGEALREQVAKQVPLAGAMTPAEFETLADAAQAAMWFHFQATTWDKRRELELAKVVASD